MIKTVFVTNLFWQYFSDKCVLISNIQKRIYLQYSILNPIVFIVFIHSGIGIVGIYMTPFHSTKIIFEIEIAMECKNTTYCSKNNTNNLEFIKKTINFYVRKEINSTKMRLGHA